MPISPEAAALALVCRPDGVLADVIYDELGLKPSHDFFSLVHSSNLRKAKRFLKTVVASHSAFDWEINLSLADGNVPFFFSGAMTNRGIVVIGTKGPAAANSTSRAVLKAGTEAHSDVLGPAIQELVSLRQAKARTRRRMRRELSRLNKAIEEPAPEGSSKTHSAGQLSAIRTLAHDLRNPISGILTASQYLIEDASPLLETEHIALLQSIESSSEFMLKLIRDMLQVVSGRREPPSAA